jgi:hypothetical protein
LIVQIVSCGVNWWWMHPKDLDDPYCFARKACWLNSTGLMYGRRLPNCHTLLGQVRFNRTSGFNPEFVDRLPGKTFHSPGPRLYEGKVRLLFDLPVIGQPPDAYLVSLTESRNGEILFRRSGWRLDQVTPISISRQRNRYEVMALMTKSDWIETSLGVWGITEDGRELVRKEGAA